jgi:hypothetical protein
MVPSNYAKTAIASSISGNNEAQRQKPCKHVPASRLVCVELNPGPYRRRRGRIRQRARGGGGLSIIRSPATLFPAAIQVRQNYTDSRDLSLTSGIFASYVYRMNSTFDPDYTGAGGQPYGRDQFAAIYSKYRVDAFHWDVSMAPNSVGLGLCASVATCPANTPGPFSLITDVADLPWAKTGIAPGTATPFKSRGGFPLREFLGQSQAQFVGDDSNESVVGSNATALAYFHISAQNNAGNTQSITYVAKLTYVVTYFLPLTMPPS